MASVGVQGIAADGERADAPGGAAERIRMHRLGWAALALQLALLLHSAWRVGPTYDEHYYIASGQAYLRDGDFALNREHPPLLKLLAGFPLLLAPGVDFPEHWRDQVAYPASFFYQRNAADLDRNLFLARLPFCLLAALLALAVGRTAERISTPRAGLVALLLFAFNPNVLAHGPLAALDLGVAAFLFFAVVAFAALLADPGWRRALGAALAFGLACLAKFTSLLLVPVFLALALVAAARGRSPRPLGWTAAVFLGGLSAFALVYRFEAISAWAAWSEPAYRTDVEPAGPDPAPSELAAAGAAAGLAPASAAALAGAPDLHAAIEIAGAAAREGGAAEARGVVVALGSLEPASGEVRKHAFALLFHLGPAWEADPAGALGALSRLAWVELPDRDAARRFFARERGERWDRALFSQGWIDGLSRGLLGDRRPIPLFSALKGLDYQVEHARHGHPSYFRGEVLTPGVSFEQGNPHPEYYAWVLAVKDPLVALVLFLGGLVLVFRRGSGWTLIGALALVGTPLVLFAVFSRSNTLLGVKYLLPVFPFLCVLAGRTAEIAPRLAPVLALVAAAEGLWIHPHELMYYNAAAGGPVGGPAITVVGDNWGQDVREVGRFLARHADSIEAAGGLYYEPYSVADPRAFGLERAKPVEGRIDGREGRRSGIVAVNAIDYYREERRYGWLREYRPFVRIGWSVYVYDTRVAPPGGDPLDAWEQMEQGSTP